MSAPGGPGRPEGGGATRRVILDALRVQAPIGMLEHERRAAQPLTIRAEFDTDAARPVDDADIGTVLDYRLLRAALVEEATRAHTDLLETLVDRTLDRVLRDFPAVLEVKIRICKPRAFDDCTVCIEQSRRR
ncbi:dihydroneopterin aldolase [Castellaniella defragrans]|uniref:Dihydroneopterin aldolase n=1 Tax=Castellaniella defragrans (strain DSM 12143 / CCUG 39792 / 65Phen) TaxID=1437824 RepID=W8XA43_CASD6|nr:dihydroneopterin aldolase [Castellaniella defragrans]CDM25925.1 Dihydroneopterin aldolase [Castellaniella defragrans 65Phen]